MSGVMNMLLGARTAIAAAVDEFFNRVTLLLPGDGTNGAQNNTFLDSSTNNFTITRNGNTTQGTFSPFSQTGWGVRFGEGNYATFPLSSNYDIVAGDFTIDVFLFLDTINPVIYNGTIIAGNFDGGNGGGGWLLTIDGVGAIDSIGFESWSGGVSQGRATFPGINTTTFTLNTWHHLRVCKSGSNYFAYLNGTNYNGARTGPTTQGAGSTFGFAAYRQNLGYPSWFRGSMSNFRLIKGTALSTGTSSITVPTSSLSNVTNTTILTFQSNRFLESIANPTWTIAGSTSIQPFSPFAPTIPYSAATVGGSGYFDGSGDNLVTPSNTAFDPSGQNVTVDFWVYLTRYPQANNIVFEVGNSSVGDLQCNILNTGEVRFTTGGNVGSTISGFNLNAWHYITCVKSGTSFTVYLNAVAGTGATLTPNSKTTMYIGSQSGGTNIEGYISNFRYVRGSANVPSSVPTVPLTAITNTSLLLNFTNAGITDATAKNDLETVGNAQISTTQSKFGGSSMSFGGSGGYCISNNSVANSAFGTGDFTVEFWLYTNAGGTTYNVIDWRPFGTQGAYFTFYLSSGVPIYYTGSADRITGGSAIPATTWTHVAISRSGTSTKMFINGTQSGSTYTDTTNYLGLANRPAFGGGGIDANSTLNGYIDDLRITKYARYTSNFTPPTAAFPLQ